MIYLTLFLWSFLAATILPVGSEPVLVALVYSEKLIAVPVLIATAGNYLGACTTWWIGIAGAGAIEKRSGFDVSQSKHGRLLRRYGAPSLLLSWVPWIGDPLVALAGASGIGFRSFSLWTIPGKAARYLLVAWIAASV